MVSLKYMVYGYKGKNDYPRENIHFSVFGKVGQK